MAAGDMPPPKPPLHDADIAHGVVAISGISTQAYHPVLPPGLVPPRVSDLGRDDAAWFKDDSPHTWCQVKGPKKSGLIPTRRGLKPIVRVCPKKNFTRSYTE